MVKHSGLLLVLVLWGFERADFDCRTSHLHRLTTPNALRAPPTKDSKYSDESNLQPASMTNTKVTIEVPENSDVLCGRGGLSNKHPGNRLFRRLVQENKTVYQLTIGPSHKQFLVMSIMEAIHNQGGRFIRQEGGNWVEISRRQVAIKTSQALRENVDSSNFSSCTSSSHSTTSVRISSTPSSLRSKEAVEKQRQEKMRPRSSIALAQTLFSVADEVLRTCSEHSCAEVSGDECDFEPIRVCEQRTSCSTTSSSSSTPELQNEDDFEPIGINPDAISAEPVSSDLDDLIFRAIAGFHLEGYSK